jgi:Raf kinase inhibitor-like YbhB/YbcL family protein
VKSSSILLVCATTFLMLVCAAPSRGSAAAVGSDSTMTLVSSAFGPDESIPTMYSLFGDNVSPDLTWANVPEGTKSLALICRDPDAPAGTFYHWVLFNVPQEASGLPAGLARTAALPGGGVQGRNSFHRLGYDGPKPPSGTHRYYFDLYALDVKPALDQSATAERLLESIKGHVLAQASLMGKYTK